VEYRIEHDTMGEMRVPADALYGAQTERGAENFPISRLRFPPAFILALGLIKSAAARVNGRLGQLPADLAAALEEAAAIAKEAYRSGRTVRGVAREMSGIPEGRLNELLDPRSQTGAA
jgi:fumarate hydratase class II